MSEAAFHGYIPIQGRGTVTLPAALRRRLRLDEPGAQLELTERADGVIEVRAVLPVRVDQQWFWDERWQSGEREVEAHITEGDERVHGDVEHLLRHLNDVEAR